MKKFINITYCKVFDNRYGQNLGEMHSNVEIMFSKTFENTAINARRLKGTPVLKLNVKIPEYLGIDMNWACNTHLGLFRRWISDEQLLVDYCNTTTQITTYDVI